MSDFEIKPDPWVGPYVNRLFTTRGVSVEEASEMIGLQWDNWKRLLAETGLMQSQKAANEVAYAFSQTRVVGGAGRIFEHFAAFVKQGTSAVREFHEERSAIPAGYSCDACEGMGVVMVPMENMKTGEINDKAFSCTCDVGRVKFGGVPAALPEMLEFARRKNREEVNRLNHFLHSRGVQHGTGFTGMLHKIHDHLRGKKQREIDEKRDLVHAEQCEAETSLLVYHNGDERGWFE